MSSEIIARRVLIVGVAIVFLYFGIDKFMNPFVWLGWLPAWMDSFAGLGKHQWLKIIGGIEIAVGLGVLMPFDFIQKLAAFIATIHLAAILTQTGLNDIAVRDIGLMFMTLALWFLI